MCTLISIQSMNIVNIYAFKGDVNTDRIEAVNPQHAVHLTVQHLYPHLSLLGSDGFCFGCCDVVGLQVTVSLLDFYFFLNKTY